MIDYCKAKQHNTPKLMVVFIAQLEVLSEYISTVVTSCVLSSIYLIPSVCMCEDGFNLSVDDVRSLT